MYIYIYICISSISLIIVIIVIIFVVDGNAGRAFSRAATSAATTDWALYVYVCVCVYTCVYVYVCIYIYIYITGTLKGVPTVKSSNIHF